MLPNAVRAVLSICCEEGCAASAADCLTDQAHRGAPPTLIRTVPSSLVEAVYARRLWLRSSSSPKPCLATSLTTAGSSTEQGKPRVSA